MLDWDDGVASRPVWAEEPSPFPIASLVDFGLRETEWPSADSWSVDRQNREFNDYHLLDDDWLPVSGKPSSPDIIPQMYGDVPPDDDGATEVDPIEVLGRRIISDEQLQIMIDDYNRINQPLPTSGGSGSGNPAPPHLPPLQNLSCEDLAFLEQERTRKIDEGRAFSINVLALTGDAFRGEQAFNEFYAAFERLLAEGNYSEGNPVGNVWNVYLQAGDPHSALSTSLRSMGVSLALEFTVISVIESVFRAQKELDKIDAEQARRGGRCG